MPTRISELGDIRTELSAGFDLDVTIQRIYAQHPLRNAIAWDYFANSTQNMAVGLQSVFGITDEVLMPIVRERMREPKDIPLQFWYIHQTWSLPSMKQISTWRKDLVTIVDQLVRDRRTGPVFEVINPKLPGLVDEMKKEFPDISDGFDQVFQQSFSNAVKVYLVQLNRRDLQAARVYYVEQDKPNQHNLFHVINYCVRLLTEVLLEIRRTVGGQDDLQRSWVESAFSIGEEVETAELKLWPLICCDLMPKMVWANLNTDPPFWQIPMVQTLVQFKEETEGARDMIQLMIMYSDVHPPDGIDAAISQEVKRSNGKDWEEIRETGLFHTQERPMMYQPWAKVNSPWINGQITLGNMRMIQEFLKQVPRVEEVYRQKGLRHDGELKYGGLQATFPGPLDLQPSVEYFDKRQESEVIEVIETEKTNYLPYIAIAAVAGYFLL